MSNITINNYGTINICDDTVSNARNQLLTKLYWARNKDTMGGYKAWLNLLEMYYLGNFDGMREFISSCTGKGGKTRNECLNYIDIIMKGSNN